MGRHERQDGHVDESASDGPKSQKGQQKASGSGTGSRRRGPPPGPDARSARAGDDTVRGVTPARPRAGAALATRDESDRTGGGESRSNVIFRYRLDPDPGIDFVSDSIADVTGYAAAECYADPYLAYAIVHPDDLPLLLQIDPIADANRPLLLRWVRRDRHVIWTRHLHAPVYDDKGHLVAVEGVARDVTASVLADLGLPQPVLGRGPTPLLSLVPGGQPSPQR